MSKFEYQKITKVAVGASFIFGILAINSLPALAETPASDELSSRYLLQPDGDKIIRMDKETGQMSICTRKLEDIICRMAVDDRDALMQEMTKLQDKIATLEGAAQFDSNKSDSNKSGSKMPEAAPDATEFDKEVDRVLDYSSRVLRRFFDVMKDIKKDFEKPA